VHRMVQQGQVRASEQEREVSPINCRTIASLMTCCCRSDHHSAIRRHYKSAMSNCYEIRC